MLVVVRILFADCLCFVEVLRMLRLCLLGLLVRLFMCSVRMFACCLLFIVSWWFIDLF